MFCRAFALYSRALLSRRGSHSRPMSQDNIFLIEFNADSEEPSEHKQCAAAEHRRTVQPRSAISVE